MAHEFAGGRRTTLEQGVVDCDWKVASSGQWADGLEAAHGPTAEDPDQWAAVAKAFDQIRKMVGLGVSVGVKRSFDVVARPSVRVTGRAMSD